MKHEDVPIAKIKIGNRFRQDPGDVEALAQNIHEMGLLQPIGIDRYYNLIFGWRRMFACSDILQWESIPCVVLDIESILAGEYAENEFRKAFTPSEREAIGRAVEVELGKRHGGDRKSTGAIAALDHSEKGKNVDIAARRAGFSSAETYERAKKVADRGAAETIAAMDSGDLSISAAAAIASQPKDEQQKIVAMPKDQRREVVSQIRKTKADKEADERRARDLKLYRGLYDAVHFLADFYEDPKETWAGLWRVSAFKFASELDRAIECLARIKKEHPNETTRKPRFAP